MTYHNWHWEGLEYIKTLIGLLNSLRIVAMVKMVKMKSLQLIAIGFLFFGILVFSAVTIASKDSYQTDVNNDKLIAAHIVRSSFFEDLIDIKIKIFL